MGKLALKGSEESIIYQINLISTTSYLVKWRWLC